MQKNLSLLGKSWQIQKSDSTLSPLERLLAIREISKASEEEFLNPSLDSSHSPKEFKDLEKSVERIREAIQKKERIFIVGDYDADGVTASAILFKALTKLEAKVSIRLPSRQKHGYGLNTDFINEAKELEVNLIITVDNGISAKEEIKLANSLGINVIITDHHIAPAELPAAYAIINPRQEKCSYPYQNLSGATIAYKLATALLNLELKTQNEESPFAEASGDRLSTINYELLTLAAIGTLADVCPLTGENRIIVAEGLKKIFQNKNPGLQRILKNSKIEKACKAEDIAFRIAPRINAAGRLSDPLIAFQALTNESGAEFADQLETLNQERRAITSKALIEAEQQIQNITDKKIIIASHPDWHIGVIGLIAGKLAEKYNRPAVIMNEHKGIFTGSCRSPIADFNITTSLAELSELLEKFGGHSAAAGFTLKKENRSSFEKELSQIAEKELSKVELTPSISIDLEITDQDINFDLLKQIKRLAPFGESNPEPVLLLHDIQLNEIRAVGSEAKHLRLKLGKQNFTAIGFWLGELASKIKNRQTIDLAFTLDENVWNGNRDLQLKIVDIR